MAKCSKVTHSESAGTGTQEGWSPPMADLWAHSGRSEGFSCPPKGPGDRGSVSFEINMKQLSFPLHPSHVEVFGFHELYPDHSIHYS